MLFAFPLGKKSEPRASKGGSSRASHDRAEVAGPPPATDRVTALVRLKPRFRKALLLIRSFSALRAWSLAYLGGRRGLIGAGVAVVLVFAVWIATRSSGPVHRASHVPVASPAPAASSPAVPRVEPMAIIVPLAAPPALPASPSPPAPGTLATAGQSEPRSHVRAHGTSPASARARSRAARARTTTPRAGKLSADDF